MVPAPTGDDGTYDGGVAAVSGTGSWLPPRLRRTHPSQQCDQWRPYRHWLATAQGALEQMHKEEESRSSSSKAAKRAKGGCAAYRDGAGTAGVDGKAAVYDKGKGPQAAPLAAGDPLPTGEEPGDLVAEME